MFSRKAVFGGATPPPTFVSSSPRQGVAGQALAVTGTNFAQGMSVTVGGVAAGSVTVSSPTSLTCTVPNLSYPSSTAARIATTTYTQSAVQSGASAATYAYMNNGSAVAGAEKQTSTGAPAAAAGAWVRADAGSAQFIEFVQIGYDYTSSLVGGPAVTAGLTVQGSLDGTTWTYIATTPDYTSLAASGAASNGLVNIGVNATWRYIRLLQPATGRVVVLEFGLFTGSSALNHGEGPKNIRVINAGGDATGSGAFTYYDTRPNGELVSITTEGYYDYTIPEWADRVDAVLVGGGGGGQGGGAGYNGGAGGSAGSRYSVPFTRGADLSWTTTTIGAYVGGRGTGGLYGGAGPTAGGTPALKSVYGATGSGGGSATNGTNSITASWSHTPAVGDTWVIVPVGVSGTGIGVYTGHTRTVTYGGTPMTSISATNCGTSTGANGWLEFFALQIRTLGSGVSPGNSGPKTVSVTVSKASTTYSYLKANSVSYGLSASLFPNQLFAAVPNAVFGGSSSPATQASNFIPEGIFVGAMFSVGTGTFTSTDLSGLGTAQRHISNTAPAFVIVDDQAGYAADGTLSATSAWGAVGVVLGGSYAAGGNHSNVGGTGSDGTAGQDRTALTTSAPTYWPATYAGATGGIAGTALGGSSGQGGGSPGAGGGGGGGVLVGGTNGGNGGTAQVSFRAYQAETLP